MDAFSIHHNHQVITCISAAVCSGIRYRRFVINDPCHRLFIERNHKFLHGLGFKPGALNQLVSQATTRLNTTDILWIRPDAAQLILNRPFHPKTTGLVYHPTLANWVFLVNGHLILNLRFLKKHTTDFPLPYSSHLSWKNPRLIPQTLQTYRLNIGARFLNLHTTWPSGNRHLRGTLSDGHALRNEFIGIIKATSFYFQRSHIKQHTVASYDTGVHGRLLFVRNPAILSGNDADNVIIQTTNPKTPIEVGKPITGQSLPNRQYLPYPCHFPLPPMRMTITTSAAHNILRHHSLRIIDRRILKIDYNPTMAAQAKSGVNRPTSIHKLATRDLIRSVGEALKSVHETSTGNQVSPNTSSIPSIISSGPIAETTVITPSIAKRKPYKKVPLKLQTKRDHGTFFLINLLLFALIVYLGFNTFQTILYARSLNNHVPNPALATTQSTDISSRKPQSLNVYRAIWQQDLFHTITAQNLKDQETISVEDVPHAQKDLGIVLIGTIASDDPGLSRAIISYRRMKQQVAYSEGDNVGGVQIKKILLGKVIITTEDGNQLLTVEHKTGRQKSVIDDDMDLEEDSFDELQALKKRRVFRRKRANRARNLKQNDNTEHIETRLTVD